jgi:predicted transcriptional regulator
MEKKRKKNNIFFHILNFTPCGFTQISSGSTHLTGNSIPHPTSTNMAYVWWTLLHKELEIHEKRDDDVNITFFHVFLISHGV